MITDCYITEEIATNLKDFYNTYETFIEPWREFLCEHLEKDQCDACILCDCSSRICNRDDIEDALYDIVYLAMCSDDGCAKILSNSFNDYNNIKMDENIDIDYPPMSTPTHKRDLSKCYVTKDMAINLKNLNESFMELTKPWTDELCNSFESEDCSKCIFKNKNKKLCNMKRIDDILCNIFVPIVYANMEYAYIVTGEKYVKRDV